MTKARRGNGEGSIYQDGRGLWRAVITLDHGRRKYLSGRTRGDVLRKLKEAQRATERGVDLTADRLTVGEWLDRWLGKRQVEVTTYHKYETCVRLHLKPGLGQLHLARLRAEDIEDWLARLEADGLGAARRQTLLKVLRSALKAAEPRGYLPRGNVAQYVEMPQAPKRRRQAPDPTRVSRLLATVREDPRLEAFVLLCLGGELRRGEVLGLTWGAVDLESGRLTVRARVNRVSAKLGGLLVRPGAKSEAGERTTYVAPFVVEALRRLRTHVRKQRLAKGALGSARMILRSQTLTCS